MAAVQPQTRIAIVKAVPSADRLILAGKPDANGQAPERELVISGITTPRLARNKDGKDEPFAWEAKEFLRRACIGKQVYFQVDFEGAGKNDQQVRGLEYGRVTVDGQNVAQLIVAAGWGKVKVPKEGSSGVLSADKQILKTLQDEAEALQAGLHQKVDPATRVRTIDWNPDCAALFQSMKDLPIPCVVDKVLDGSQLRLELLYPNQATLHHTMITLQLAGVQCPAVPLPAAYLQKQYEQRVAEDASYAGAKPGNAVAPPFALEAQSFVAARLLNQQCFVVLQAIDKQNNLFGSIQFSKGNISLKLLEQGLGKLVPWSAAACGHVEAQTMATAEALAKHQNLRIWSLMYDDPSSAAALNNEPREFQNLKVTQVSAADRITCVDAAGKEYQFTFASIKTPRLARRGGDERDEPYAFAAKDFVRRKLIKRSVRVVVEYRRQGAAVGPEDAKNYVTVYLNGENVSLLLVQQGYAEVMKHRRDEDRAAAYDQLMAAEQAAKAAKRGIHGPASQGNVKITDLTLRKGPDAGKPAGVSRARAFLSTIKGERLDAVVEYVFGGARFKVYLPKYTTMISLGLAGISCSPAVNRNGQEDAIGKLALEYSRDNLLQTDVKIEVDDVDKAETFMGSVFVNGLSYSVALLSEGLASTNRNTPYLRNAAECVAAEQTAQAARVNLWVNYDAEEEARLAAEQNGTDSSATWKPVSITEIVDPVQFYARLDHSEKNENAVRDALMEVSREPLSDEAVESFVVSKGLTCAGLFEDGEFHRVRVDKRVSDSEFQCIFIDFGNRALLKTSDLRPLSEAGSAVPPLAVHCVLAGVKAPSPSSEFFDGAAEAFNALTLDQDLVGRVELRKDGKCHMVLRAAGTAAAAASPSADAALAADTPAETINQQLLRQGWVRINSKADRALAALTKTFEADQRLAQEAHLGQWEYGNVSSDDEEEPVLGKKGGNLRYDGRPPPKQGAWAAAGKR